MSRGSITPFGQVGAMSPEEQGIRPTWAYPLDDHWYTAKFFQHYHGTRTNGIYSAPDDLRVTAAGGRNLNVSVGMAWLNIRPRQGIQYVNETVGGLPIEVAIGDFTRPRIDRVVIRHDFIANDAYIAVVQGIPNANPQAPALERNTQGFELGIATVLVQPGSIAIPQGDITDTRLDEAVCGLMRDAITQIPTQQLHDQWTAWFNDLSALAGEKARDFISWLTDFRNTKEDEMSTWIDRFKATNTEWWNQFTATLQATTEDWISDFKVKLSAWFLRLREEKEKEFDDWFALLQNTLDDNQAGNLFNLIQEHERKSITDPDGVHNLRLTPDGNFEVRLPSGAWYVLIGARRADWNHRDALNRSWIDWEARAMTWDELDNMKEVQL